MPNDTAYVGIIRDPFHQFISIVNYLKPNYFEDIKGDDKLMIYLTNPKKYEPRNPIISFTNNRMAIELGFPPEVVYSKNPEKIKQYLKELEDEFPVMLILEKFDESLLIMQKHFKWQTKDILYFKKNIGALTRTYSADSATEEHLNLFKHWAFVDYQLYKHFQDRLEQQIQEFGDDFVQKLDNFQDILRKIEDFCIHKIQEPLKPGISRHIGFPANKWDAAFNVTRDDCHLLLLDEIQFIQMIRKRQYGTERL
ncbi:hypothetical protein ACJMK2_012091 [Sinanodonta woodiana]|uniref:Uncharacterized protein n=1 Tax=Sinanodonta woodiana TaxID=1069815 RepID=A0ABD3V728_SINWO